MDANQIIVMEDGRIADMGNHAELLERCSAYREIHESPDEQGGERIMPGPGRNKRTSGFRQAEKYKKDNQTAVFLSGTGSGKLSVVLVCVIVTAVSSLAGSYMLRPVINGLTSGQGQCGLSGQIGGCDAGYICGRYCLSICRPEL